MWSGLNNALSHTLNVRLSGTDWFTGSLRVTGEARMQTNLSDADGNQRYIPYVELAGLAQVRLVSTEIGTLVSRNGNAAGPSGLDIVTGQSHLAYLRMAEGNNVVRVGSGDVGTIVSYNSNNTILVGSNTVDMMSLGNGKNQIVVNDGGRVSFVNAFGGNNALTLNGDSRALTVKFDESVVNRLTTADGNVETYYSYASNNILKIGAGGLFQATLTGDGQSHRLTSDGFIGSYSVFGESSSIVFLRNGDAENIRLGHANNVVVTTDSFVANLLGGNARDVVTIGAAGAAKVDLRGGDDLLTLRPFAANETIVVNGGSGVDTLDLSKMNRAITIDLSLRLQEQDVASGRGNVAVFNVENVTGGAFTDRITGNGQANTLIGGGGDDTILGGGGNDLLIGGGGNDTLTGGAGADTFLFAPISGRDVITDFELGVDAIRFTSATGLADIAFNTVSDGVRLVQAGTQVTVLGVSLAEMQDADNFLF